MALKGGVEIREKPSGCFGERKKKSLWLGCNPSVHYFCSLIRHACAYIYII